jgi:3-polyprenyl-4-hydroxybenzoate decarboxylase
MQKDKDYDGLRSFLAKCEALGEVKVIKNADWNLEIGALTETVSELIDEPPALMFDEIKGYPKGFRATRPVWRSCGMRLSASSTHSRSRPRRCRPAR